MSGERQIELLEPLGKGGFGAVWLARVSTPAGLVQTLAVKVLDQRMAEIADMAGRQRDEARLLGLLNHDHIVKVHDLVEHEGRPAVLMEYIEGADLGKILRRGPLPPKAALQAGAAVASALDAAWSGRNPETGHPLRVIHRDIKPANLLLSAQGVVKVLDFGIARGNFDREGRTQSVQFGTPRFMAPEQWLHNQLSPAVDVFALGLCLVEMLSGVEAERLPLQEGAYRQEVDRRLARLPLGDEPWADSTRATLRTMLAYTPDGRPNARELADRLLGLADDASGPSLGRFARAQAAPPDPTPPDMPEGTPPTEPATPGRTSGLELSVAATTPLPASGNTSLLVDPNAPTAKRSPETPTARPRPRTALGLLGLAIGLGLVATYAWPTAGPTSAAPPSLAPSYGPAPFATPSTTEVGTPKEEATTATTTSPPPTVEPVTVAGATAQARPPSPSASPRPAPVTPSTPPAEPATEQPATPAPLGKVTFSSRPIGAHLTVDGRAAPSTPAQLTLEQGPHVIQLSQGEHSTEHTIDVEPQAPAIVVWNSADDTWSTSASP